MNDFERHAASVKHEIQRRPTAMRWGEETVQVGAGQSSNSRSLGGGGFGPEAEWKATMLLADFKEGVGPDLGQLVTCGEQTIRITVRNVLPGGLVLSLAGIHANQGA